MKRIGVLHISNQLGLGGTDATLQVLASRLNEHYFDVYAAGINQGGPRETTLRGGGVPVLVAHGDLSRLATFIQDHHLDIVHLHHCSLPIELLSGSHVALTHQFSTCLYPREQELELSKLLFNSTRTLQKYLATYHIGSVPTNAEIVFNPIDLNEIERIQSALSPRDIAEYRASLGIAPGSFVIGRLGRADIVKWSDYLVDAVRPLLRADRSIILVLQTAPVSRIKKLDAELGPQVRVLGESASPEQLALFLSTIDVYTHTSRIGESFGVSIAEAMAFKKPVVVNSTPAADNAQIELVDNGVTGYVVNYPTEFAQAIRALRANKELVSRMGEAGYHKVKSRYAADRVTGQYERILFNMAGVSDDPEISDYMSTLPTPMTRAEIQSSFGEYERRLRDTFGSISARELLSYRLREPSRFVARVKDYLEYRRQLTRR